MPGEIIGYRAAQSTTLREDAAADKAGEDRSRRVLYRWITTLRAAEGPSLTPFCTK